MRILRTLGNGPGHYVNGLLSWMDALFFGLPGVFLKHPHPAIADAADRLWQVGPRKFAIRVPVAAVVFVPDKPPGAWGKIEIVAAPYN